MVHCKKLGQELPAIPFQPLPNEFGREIFENVSMEAWQMWLRESPRYINTMGFDLQRPDHQAELQRIMRVFFGFDDGDMPDTAWRPPE
jgi:Fe-S cluster biosynthesis and repair protein YggX